MKAPRQEKLAQYLRNIGLPGLRGRRARSAWHTWCTRSLAWVWRAEGGAPSVDHGGVALGRLRCSEWGGSWALQALIESTICFYWRSQATLAEPGQIGSRPPPQIDVSCFLPWLTVGHACHGVCKSERREHLVRSEAAMRKCSARTINAAQIRDRSARAVCQSTALGRV